MRLKKSIMLKKMLPERYSNKIASSHRGSSLHVMERAGTCSQHDVGKVPTEELVQDPLWIIEPKYRPYNTYNRNHNGGAMENPGMWQSRWRWTRLTKLQWTKLLELSTHYAKAHHLSSRKPSRHTLLPMLPLLIPSVALAASMAAGG